MVLLIMLGKGLYDVIHEKTLTTLWLRVEKIFMIKFIYSKLLLKRGLFGLV